MSTETDPHGRNPHQPGAKLDAGKNRLGLVMQGFPRALQAVGHVATYGAEKYTPDGWKSVPNGIERYTDAMYRHLLAEATGELQDQDTRLLHAAHAAWNALARLELLLVQQHWTRTYSPQQEKQP
ncbi:dATP/dGTP diphosphohydrolase domain-containing protein [Brachymonas sp.]|uniref:dATP/dGTP diphosphohydrolase domain-containing protein n=1 Tax=Brachymonas sp. TaxID=1936292 RepID=UPI0035AE7DB8